MSVSVFSIQDTEISERQIYNLIKIAFQERKEAGLNYGCLSLSFEAFLKEIEDNVILVAVDDNLGVLCGCTMLSFRMDKHGKRYGWERHTSVHPDYKGMGVGTMLISELKNKAIEFGCEYLGCSTAVEAESAVKVHLKNGYQIIGLKSYKSTNYYSFIFRMQLSPSRWSDPAFCKKQFKKSQRKVRLAYKADGSYTFLGKVLAKFGIKW